MNSNNEDNNKIADADQSILNRAINEHCHNTKRKSVFYNKLKTVGNNIKELSRTDE